VHGLDAQTLAQGLARTLARGTLITATLTLETQTETLYFANSAAGRDAVAQVTNGHWLPGEGGTPFVILPPRPTVYHLYEENIGALTPLVADDLKDTEAEFGSEALADAIRYAVTAEKRSMRYIRAVLEGWRREGKLNAQAGGYSQGAENRQFLSGKYADFIDR
jgi:DnaD/phage-associated family protein